MNRKHGSAAALRAVVTGLCLVASGIAPRSVAAHSRPRAADADSLYRRALDHLARRTHDERRLALRDLDDAVRLAGQRADLLHAVAWTFSAMGHYREARSCLDRITRLTPDDAAAQRGLGELWKWEWLASVEPSDYRKSLEHFMQAAETDPRDLKSRLAVTALALVRRNLVLAKIGARSAVTCDPDAVEAALALGCASYAAGELARADSAFGAATPRIPPQLRMRFTDPDGIASGAPGPPLTPEEADSAGNAYWRDRDPDLTTPENEARLDFLSRVGLAVLLFQDREGVRWDTRAEVLARFGIPDKVMRREPPGVYEDLDSYQAFAPLRLGYEFAGRHVDGGYHPPDATIEFPFHRQVWIYPNLGVSMDLWDRSLHESYGLATDRWSDPDQRAVPWRLALQPELVAFDGGRCVYRALAPGIAFMPAQAAVACFPTDMGARVVADLATEGGPADSMWGAWVVKATGGKEMARNEGLLSSSSCDPTGRRIIQFDADVPAGDYQVHLSVTDRRGRRGVVHLESHVAPPTEDLALSQLVLVCATPSAGEPAGPVRIEPDFDHRVASARAVSAYFEVDHLSLGPDGRSRFAYQYAVRRVGHHTWWFGRNNTVFEASREEDNVGVRRRQFVSVPIPSLGPGTYELEIVVRDVRSAASAKQSVQFVRSRRI